MRQKNYSCLKLICPCKTVLPLSSFIKLSSWEFCPIKECLISRLSTFLFAKLSHNQSRICEENVSFHRAILVETKSFLNWVYLITKHKIVIILENGPSSNSWCWVLEWTIGLLDFGHLKSFSYNNKLTM